ncbi:hypothetical protein WH87_14745 [Devosia epidermidihirudinis]|uniref:Motility protein n=1 Tax=Devosia epidermidihirudinis TaxID=1293439 RepID=A0A0F5Q4M9_9HYPH|nr:putative motility protein [Devosia epidermidihirudinis]KKC35830.1 hypothetical protein WH87_14745 [Devosia epidermidihirudinis]
MNADLSMQMLAMSSAKTQSSVEIAVFKKMHDLQTATLETLMETALSAPPPGQGLKIDKLA